jgi:hypothetical protein
LLALAYFVVVRRLNEQREQIETLLGEKADATVQAEHLFALVSFWPRLEHPRS